MSKSGWVINGCLLTAGLMEAFTSLRVLPMYFVIIAALVAFEWIKEEI